MKNTIARLAGALLALTLTTSLAAAQSKVTVAVGGGSCLCYLPTVLAKQLGEYEKAGLNVELVDLKGGSDALKAVLGGSADVVSGYFDHCVNLAAKKQELQSFVVYDRYPGLVLVVAPSRTNDIKSVKDLAGKKVGVSAPGSSTDFFLKYMLKKNGLDPTSAAVIGVGLGATAVAAMEQGQIDAAVMLDPSVTVLQGSHKDLRILSDTRTQKDTLETFGGEYPGGALYSTAAWVNGHEKETQALTNAILATLAWIHSHSPEEIMAKMPGGDGRQEQGPLSRRAEEHDSDVLRDRQDGPEGRRRRACGVQRRFARGGERQDRRQQDLHQQIRRSGQEDHRERQIADAKAW
ncbi:NitT/TauT family transport system substrate-binding protein [Bradyrhizobium sp. USDA 377]